MNSELIGARTKGDRAVSPVIGVILMVAITVILAAVIGAFVLEIGDQQETAPNTSFDSDQQTVFYQGGGGNSWKSNLTTAYFTHAGGDTVELSQFDAKVNGNGSAWGVTEFIDSGAGRDMAAPQPYHTATAGTNEIVEFKSGEEMNIMAWNMDCPSDENVKAYGTTRDSGSRYYWNYPWDDDRGPRLGYTTPGTGVNGVGNCDRLETGDDIRLTWTASSGGKTQTLFKYTVQ